MKTDTTDFELLEKKASHESLLRVNAELIANLQRRVNVSRFRVQKGIPSSLAILGL